MEELGQIEVGPLTPGASGNGFTVTVVSALVDVQPFASVTITVYVPASRPLMSSVLAVKPSGPVQAIEYGEVPPLTVCANLPNLAQEHISYQTPQ